MKLRHAIAEILARENIEIICGYPVNHILETAAERDIRPIIVRQERVGLHIADAISRMTSGRTPGVFAMQLGPGVENSYGGIAQAYAESVPLLVLPMGYERRLAHIEPNFSSTISLRTISKSVEPLTIASDLPNVMRRAFSRLRSGRGGPVVIEIPNDMWDDEVPEPLDYRPVTPTRYGPDPSIVTLVAERLLAAKHPVIYAGQGVHYAQAWPQLKELAELLGAPVTTSLGGKSAFPETHPLSLGSCGVAIAGTVRHFLEKADLIFGIGCSFTETTFGTAMPAGAEIIHATLDPMHLGKDIEASLSLLGDAGLTLDALLAVLRDKPARAVDRAALEAEIATVHQAWLEQWLPKLTSDQAPITPYRVLWDLQHTVDVANTIITHDAGSPRDQLTPFWRSITPLSYIGWGKSTQLGYGIGLAMGAKLVHPDRLCINVWGDAAIGFTGLDLETAVRERIPILSILLNNFSMAMELPIMPVSTERYRSTDISGDYAAMARSLGAYGERITDPAEIVPAILRGIEQTQNGKPALLEFITSQELAVSRYHEVK